MKLRALRLENVRRFDRPVRIDGIGDGLNLLCAPNEHGKSTLFDALHALFYARHASRAQEVQALRPHGGGAPEIRAEIESEAAGPVTLVKRWFARPEARVERAGQVIARADEAEAFIAGLVGGAEGGPAGLLWVRQGLHGLEDGAGKAREAALAARRDLLSSVAGEVDAMTGGRRMDAALARCRAELAELVTPGRAQPKGAYKAAADEAAALAGRADSLRETARALSEALDARRDARKELAGLEDPEAVEARRARLAEAEAAHEAARKHADRLEAATRARDLARLEARQAAERRAALREARTARETARKLSEEAEAALGQAEAARAAAAEADAAAEAERRALQRRLAAAENRRRRAELAQRLAEAEKAREARDSAAARARQGPDATALKEIEARAQALATAEALRDARAAHLTMRYAENREGAVALEGRALAEGERIALPGPASLEIRGVGRLEIDPGDSTGTGAADVSRAERALAEALTAVGAETVEVARAAAEARGQAARAMAEAEARLGALAPEGTDALRSAIAALPAPDDEAGPDAPPDPESADAACAEAARALSEAEAARERAMTLLSTQREARAGAEADARAARERLEAAEAALARLGAAEEAALDAEVGRLEAKRAEAEAAVAALERDAPDLEAARARLHRAREVVTAAEREAQELRLRLAGLDARIGQAAGEAVEEELADAETRRAAAAARAEAYAAEVAALQRLERALEEARSAARDRYFAPVARELRPLLHLLWPEAELSWADDTLLPSALLRDGREEPVEILSGGTQEQLALLVRLAFARMLAAQGRHAPVILDDALVFTDDDRIERMFDALHRQAGDIQILVLSCRQRAFRDLGGRRLRFAPAED